MTCKECSKHQYYPCSGVHWCYADHQEIGRSRSEDIHTPDWCPREGKEEYHSILKDPDCEGGKCRMGAFP